MIICKVSNSKNFECLKKGDTLLVVWNPNSAIWDKDMRGKKLYKILDIKNNCEIILRNSGNIFFNYRLFISGESKIVKEVFVLRDK